MYSEPVQDRTWTPFHAQDEMHASSSWVDQAPNFRQEIRQSYCRNDSVKYDLSEGRIYCSINLENLRRNFDNYLLWTRRLTIRKKLFDIGTYIDLSYINFDSYIWNLILAFPLPKERDYWHLVLTNSTNSYEWGPRGVLTARDFDTRSSFLILTADIFPSANDSIFFDLLLPP